MPRVVVGDRQVPCVFGTGYHGGGLVPWARQKRKSGQVVTNGRRV